MKFHYLSSFFFFLSCLLFPTGHAFEKVVIWGHKLHSHTHSYIHNGFFIACTHLGYPTYWFDDRDPVADFDFAHTLFITEGQVDKNIPLRQDCEYMLHNCTDHKYHALPKKNVISFQVFTDSIFSVPHLVKLDHCLYYDLIGRCLYMPWATDLLPEEIEKIKSSLAQRKIIHHVCWVGTIGEGKFGNMEELKPFLRACAENGISFSHRGGLSLSEHCHAIQESWMAPAIVGTWQKEQGYIPCRLFKNISYGQMGITNSQHAYELFEKRIVYNSDTYQLFYDAKKKMDIFSLEEQLTLMDLVKTKHTFIQRIETLLSFLQLVQNTFPTR